MRRNNSQTLFLQVSCAQIGLKCHQQQVFLKNMRTVVSMATHACTLIFLTRKPKQYNKQISNRLEVKIAETFVVQEKIRDLITSVKSSRTKIC